MGPREEEQGNGKKLKENMGTIRDSEKGSSKQEARMDHAGVAAEITT